MTSPSHPDEPMQEPENCQGGDGRPSPPELPQLLKKLLNRAIAPKKEVTLFGTFNVDAIQ